MGYLVSEYGLSDSGKSAVSAGGRGQLKLFGLTGSSFHDRPGDLENLTIDRPNKPYDVCVR